MTRADFLLLVTLGGVTGLLGRHAVGAEGSHAEVFVGTRRVAFLPLAQAGAYPITGAQGTAVIEVADGRVRVRHAPCRDKRCQHMGWLGRAGEAAVCVPGRLMVRVSGQNQSGADAIAG
jgi:hypothetical protein